MEQVEGNLLNQEQKIIELTKQIEKLEKCVAADPSSRYRP